ncbi:MAG: hypothetical protein NTY41_00785 [Proteobacteria bacterium]|nr:hypothetical protein [Pseudomonadota bacterium]
MKLELILLITVTVIAGCDSKPKAAALPQSPQIIQDQRQALDNAKGVGDVSEKQAEEQRKKVEEATK